jgi:hypothetical protein
MQFKECLSLDEPRRNSIELQNKIITLLSENHYSISQTRGLFDNILDSLERFMPISENNI